MAQKNKASKQDKGGKDAPKKKAAKNIIKHYKISGDKLEKPKTCPKCGDGYILAEHKDRFSCGNCFYTEFKNKQ